MKFFLDTAEIGEIESLLDTGMVDGVTTNPSLIARSGAELTTRIKDIASIVDGPISAECISEDYDGMIKEAHILSKIADNIAVKVPMTDDGLRVCRELRNDDIMVNVTLCFSGVQALLAAKVGASFVSPFVGRVDDIGGEGMAIIEEIVEIYDNYDFTTEVLVASVRHTNHVKQSAELGADIVTLPPLVLRQLYKHPLTEKGLEAFRKDWEKAKKS